MALIEWREEFCTGIPGVDYEHQQLIREINTIFAQVDGNADKEDVIDSLGNIYGSISAHFALEEQMMERHGYEKFDEHQADHERLLDDIRDITIGFENEDEMDAEKFTRKLNDWFQIHFSTHDSRLHGLAHMMEHEQVSESTMKRMILSAKNALLRRMS